MKKKNIMLVTWWDYSWKSYLLTTLPVTILTTLSNASDKLVGVLQWLIPIVSLVGIVLLIILQYNIFKESIKHNLQELNEEYIDYQGNTKV